MTSSTVPPGTAAPDWAATTDRPAATDWPAATAWPAVPDRPLPDRPLPESGSDGDTVVFDAIGPASYPWRAPGWWLAVAGLFGGRTGDRREPAGRRNHVLGGLAGAALVLLGLFGAGAGR